MTKMRARPGYSVNTRAHSVLRGSAFGAPSRHPLTSSDIYMQRSLPYDTRSEEYSIGDSVQRVTSYSDAVLDDNFDTSAASRHRDQRLLSAATNAIPPSVFEPVTASRPRTRYKPLSRRVHNPIIFTKTMDKRTPLPTSTLQASPKPFLSLPSSLLKYSSRARVTSLPIGVRRFTGVPVKPPMFEYEPEDKLTASAPPAPRLLAGYVSPRIASRRYKTVSRSGQSTPPYISPHSYQRSSQLLGGYVSPKYISPNSYQRSSQLLGGYVSPKLTSTYHYIGTSPYRPLSLVPYTDSGMQSPTYSSLPLTGHTNLHGSYVPGFSRPQSQLFSPCTSGRQSPIFLNEDKPFVHPHPETYSDSDYDTDTNHYPHRRRKVLGSKRRVSNYYKRLARKRAGKQGGSKYWPYYDVESIGSSDISDVLSDTDSVTDYVNTYSTGGRTYDIDDEDVDYVPFKPTHSTSQGYLELTSFEDETPKYESMRVLPYIPSSLSPSVSSYDKTNDMYFNKLVSGSTARARNALSSLLRTYDDATLLMSVEGDATSQHHDGTVGFRYYHPPVSVKGRGVDRRLLTLPSIAPGHSDFLGDYTSKMRSLQQDVRSKLLKESGVREISPYSYEQRLRFMPVTIDSMKHVVPVTSFRKRLAGGLRHRLDVFHLPLVEKVLPESSQPLVLSSAKELLSHGGDASLTPLKLSVLDKIRIKVSSESHASPGSAVASRRARTRPPAPRPVPLQTRHVVSKVAAISIPASKLELAKARPYDNKRIIIVVQDRAAPKSLVVSKLTKAEVPKRVIVKVGEIAQPPIIKKMAATKASAVYLPGRIVTNPAVVTKLVATKAAAVYLPRRIISKPAVVTKMAYTKPPAVYVPRRTPVKRARVPLRVAPASRRLAVVSTYKSTRLPYYYIARSRSLSRSPLKTVQRPNVHRKPRKRAKDSYAPAVSTSAMHASRPPFRVKYSNGMEKKGQASKSPMPTERKSIRDVDGFTKPRNILSWQYRLESRVNPTEVMYKPGAYSRMREQVRDAHDKLDRHRQLLDRYLSESGEIYPGQRSHKFSEMDDAIYRTGGSSSRSSSAPPAPSQPAMSDLRRRLRKTLCKSKRDPHYYKE